MVDSSYFMNTSTTGAATGAFEYPKLYSFPPFFTLQPVAETRDKQLEAWTALVLSYARSKNVFAFDPATFSPFENKAIERSLNETERNAVVDYLLKKGACERVGDGTKKVHVLWKSIKEWETLLVEWSHRTGRREDVMTVDELCTSEEFSDEDFHGMAPSLLLKILKNLEKGKHVMLFQGSDGDDLGIKFL